MTPADVAAWLDAHPEERRQILGRYLTPWSYTHGCAWRSLLAEPYGDSAAYVVQGPRGWAWAVRGPAGLAASGLAPDRGTATRECDAALLALGRREL